MASPGPRRNVTRYWCGWFVPEPSSSSCLRIEWSAVGRPWFVCESIEEDFFDRAPVQLRETFDAPRPASEVWDELTSDNPFGWCRILQSITWTSPRPFGVGTTRTVRSLGGTSVLKERFFRWEEGRRQSLYALESSTPMFRRFAEDHLVEPTCEESCAFTWTIAVEPKPGARIANPVNRWILGTLFRDTRRHFGLAESRSHIEQIGVDNASLR